MAFTHSTCFVSAVSSAPLVSRSALHGTRLSTSQRPLHAARSPSAQRARMSFSPLASAPLSSALLLADISDVNKGSLYATAFVFFLTFWGGISFVKGSTKPRITQASFTLREPAPSVAKRTARYLMERSFVADAEKDGREGVMTFTGEVRASTSVASILVAVGASGIWSVTYILNFVLPEALQSPYWGWLSLLAFAVVPWYRKQAARTEEVKVMVEEDGDISKLYLKGHRDEIEELERAFSWKRDEPVYEGDEKADAKAASEPEKVGSK